MVARLVRDQEARSSNLRTPTKKRQRDNPPPFFLPSGDRRFAGLSSNQAQLGLGKEALRRRGRMEQSLFFRSRAALRDEALRRSLQTASAARWGEAKRPGVQISALRPKNGRGITLRRFFIRRAIAGLEGNSAGSFAAVRQGLRRRRAIGKTQRRRRRFVFFANPLSLFAHRVYTENTKKRKSARRRSPRKGIRYDDKASHRKGARRAQ